MSAKAMCPAALIKETPAIAAKAGPMTKAPMRGRQSARMTVTLNAETAVTSCMPRYSESAARTSPLV